MEKKNKEKIYANLKHLSYNIAKTYSSTRSFLLKKLAPYDEAVQMAAEYARRCVIKLTCVCTRIRHSILSNQPTKMLPRESNP